MPKTSLKIDTKPSWEDFSIQSLLSYKLHHIGAIHERIAYANMTRITNVTLPEWRVMGNIASGKVTFTQLAEELLLDKGQLSNIIKQLEKKQLVEKRKSANDGRKTLLSLTPLGLQKKVLIVNMAQQFQRVLGQGLTQAEHDLLSSALVKLECNVRNYWSENYE